MAHNLDITIIAEGVETSKQEEFLLHSNCDKAQGFHYSPAIPADKFIEFINTY